MSAAADEKPLYETYHDLMGSYIDEEGVSIAHGLAVGADGAMTMLALAVPPEQAYAVMLAQVAKGAREAIFALDRFTKPGQGTTLRDVLAGHYLVAGRQPRPFIIEYQHEPRIVKPIDWGNPFWNAGLLTELKSMLQSMKQRSATAEVSAQ